MAATRFYRAILAAESGQLANGRRWTGWLFVTLDGSLTHPAWCGLVRRSRRRPWGAGDLGQRMKLPFQVLPAGPVVLVGSDIPALHAGHVAHAFRLLGRNDLVFGPASDGGFWLVGARRIKALPRAPFVGVRWSTAQAPADTLAGLPAGYSIGPAPTLADFHHARGLPPLPVSSPGA